MNREELLKQRDKLQKELDKAKQRIGEEKLINLIKSGV